MISDLLVPMLTGPLVMALIAVVARLAAVGRIARNHAVGIRLGSTLRSDVAWRAGHRAAVLPAVWSGVLLVVADGVAVLLSLNGGDTAVLDIALVVLIVIAGAWVIIATLRAARSADPTV